MGLRSLDPSSWLEGGLDLAAQLIERDQLIATQSSIIYQEVPGHEGEIKYFIEAIIENLSRYHSHEYEIREPSITHKQTGLVADLQADQPLLELTRVIAEDLCLLKKIEGIWTLVVGAVLFPSRWSLAEKIGSDIDQIHAPVPGYQVALQPFMGATLDKLSPNRTVWRKNWSLHSTSDLHQSESIHQVAAPDDYWWRTERQTLTRSSESEAILFTIRNRAEPLSWIMARPDEASAFAATLQSMSAETIEYKGLSADHQSLVRALMIAP